MTLCPTQIQDLATPGAFEAACAGSSDLEWMPDYEQARVPAEMAEMCRQCPGRASCLLQALRTDSEGYWAGTTTAQRRTLAAQGHTSLEAADALIASDQDLSLHPGRPGSENFYRRLSCRCSECRFAHSSQRATERARARLGKQSHAHNEVLEAKPVEVIELSVEPTPVVMALDACLAVS